MLSSFRLVVTRLAMGVLLSAAAPAAAENVLRWGNADDAYTADPHSYFDADNEEVMLQIYDALVDLDSDMYINGHLAVAWKPLDPTTWEFQLRNDVRFHDGTPFTAEDVVFSIRRAQAATSGFKDFLRSIADVEAVDEHTVRVTGHTWLASESFRSIGRNGMAYPFRRTSRLGRSLTPRITPTGPAPSFFRSSSEQGESS